MKIDSVKQSAMKPSHFKVQAESVSTKEFSKIDDIYTENNQFFFLNKIDYIYSNVILISFPSFPWLLKCYLKVFLAIEHPAAQ